MVKYLCFWGGDFYPLPSVAALFKVFRQSDSTTHHQRGLVGTAQLTSVCCECDVWDLRVLKIPRVYVAYLCLFGDVVEPMRVAAAVCSLQPYVLCAELCLINPTVCEHFTQLVSADAAWDVAYCEVEMDGVLSEW